VNRPDFGTGLLQLNFAPNSSELASALQFTARAALQRYLDDLIDVQDLQVTNDEAALRVEVKYTVRRSRRQYTAQFSHGAPGA
jgi:hypothetical protein